jgi:hypothetical protein
VCSFSGLVLFFVTELQVAINIYKLFEFVVKDGFVYFIGNNNYSNTPNIMSMHVQRNFLLNQMGRYASPNIFNESQSFSSRITQISQHACL